MPKPFPKNPLLSMWLSAANAATGRARGQVAAAAKRQANAGAAEATQAVVDYWTAALTGGAKPPARRKTRR